MMCDSLERRRALLDKQVTFQPGKGTRSYISDRELVEYLLRVERELTQEQVIEPKRAAG